MTNMKLGIKAVGVFMGMLVASPAYGADPVVAGTTSIGTHPTYGSGYSAFWRAGSDYTALTDGSNSFFNAPSANGALYLRGANTDWMSLSKNGAYLNSGRFTNSWLEVGTYSSGINDITAAIGNHPTYGNQYVGFWVYWPSSRRHMDYSLLTDAANTFVNAPDKDAAVFLRTGNNDVAMVSKNQGLILFDSRASKIGGGAWSATSDVRVKKDVADFKLGLSELKKVRPVSYRYNGLAGMTDTDTKFVGVIAQELEKTLPFMVSKESKKLRPEDAKPTDVEKVDPSAFTYLLINAVKELSDENKQMKRIICQDHPHEALCAKAGR